MKKLLITILALSLFSCASKKNKQVHKEGIKVEIKKDTEIVTKEKEIEVTKEVVSVYEGSENDELTVTEIKKGVVVTKVYKGSGKLTESVKEVVKDKEVETVAIDKGKEIVEIKKEVVIKDKSTISYYWLLLLLIIPAYYIYKKTRLV